MPTRNSNIQKFVAVLRHAGVARALQLAVQKSIPHWIFDFNSLFAVEVHFDDWTFVPTPDDFPYRWGTEEDAVLLTGGGFSLDHVRYLFSEGGKPARLERDGELVTYVWYLPRGALVSDWIWILPQPGDIPAQGHQVLHKFRGQRIYQQTQNFTYSQLQAQGYRCLVSFAEGLNQPTFRAGETGRAGAGPRRYVGRITFIRVLGFVVFKLTGASGTKKWGAGFWNPRRPYRLSFDEFHQ